MRCGYKLSKKKLKKQKTPPNNLAEFFNMVQGYQIIRWGSP